MKFVPWRAFCQSSANPNFNDFSSSLPWCVVPRLATYNLRVFDKSALYSRSFSEDKAEKKHIGSMDISSPSG